MVPLIAHIGFLIYAPAIILHLHTQ